VLYGFWSPRHSTAAYKDAFAMFTDAAEVGRSEIQELVSLGCQYIQVDAPELATLVDPRVRDWAERLGFGAERMLTEGIDLINSMVEGVSGVRLGIHLCRGNNAGMWMASGGYDFIAKALFERATAFDAYFLEYDDARSGSFEPLAGAPEEKQVVLGLVSTKKPEVETAEELQSRIDDAARYFPREQLGLSTQCGFASIVAGNPITEQDEERKLRLVADTAHAVWS
jgi:5-methyltetrahydropteroyltriglutamate--homocysteine methyltransferase